MDSLEAATEIIQTLREAGHTALLAGGCVRDRLLGETPKDHDVATSARPEEVMALFERTEPVGVQFGIVLVILAGIPVEVATFRSDGPYLDGRHPASVRFATPPADARRRDFTINAMFLDPFTGTVVDHVGGRRDLANRRLRTVGEARQRFAEDRLRMLRAVRFAARFSLTVDPPILAATRELAPRIREVARERVTDELARIAAGPGLGRALGLLGETGLLSHLLPGVSADAVHRAVCDRLGEKRPPVLGLAALVWGSPEPPAILDRLRLSRADRAAVEAVLAMAREARRFSRLTVPERKRLVRRARFDEALALAEAVEGRALAAVREVRSSWSAADLHPPLHLSGDDLLRMGVPAGPEVGRVLRALEDLALAGKIGSPAEARAAVQKLRADG